MTDQDLEIKIPEDYPEEKRENAKNILRNRYNKIVENIKEEISRNYPGYNIMREPPMFKENNYYYILTNNKGQIQLKKVMYRNDWKGIQFYTVSGNSLYTDRDFITRIKGSPVWEKSGVATFLLAKSLEDSQLVRNFADRNRSLYSTTPPTYGFIGYEDAVQSDVNDIWELVNSGKVVYYDKSKQSAPGTGGKSKRHRKKSLRKRKSKKYKKRRHTKRR